ncbi:uncharacterized protein RHO25_002294 [Cercospora beticola]|nr:hypothetical protein RHO25_002294 [Cercospora beticola]
MMLRRISQPEAEHPTSVPSIPAFEVVRAPEFRVRQEELSEAGQSWTLQEVVLLRESQDFIYYLDVDDRLEIKLMDHKGTFRQFEEIRCRSPLQALYVKDLKTHSRHYLELKPRAVTENVTTRWSIDSCNNKSWSIVPTGGEREVLRGVLWTSQYNGLSDMCPLPPSSHVVRIWYSEHNVPGSAIDVQSLPSNPFLEILWNLDTDLGAHCEWDYAKSQHRNVQFIQRHWRKTVLNWIQLFSDKEKTVIDLV